VPDQGAAIVSALASILGYDGEPGKEKYTEKEIEELLSQVKDPVGTFYMYSLPASILKRKVIKK
jgi:F420-non-reducing hydrogenase small subunit